MARVLQKGFSTATRVALTARPLSISAARIASAPRPAWHTLRIPASRATMAASMPPPTRALSSASANYHVIEAKTDFDNLMASRNDGFTVVYFTAAWCGPCKAIKPFIQELAQKHTSSTVIVVDVDEQPEIAGQYGIAAMPTFLFFKGDSEIEPIVGADVASLQKTFEAHQ